MHRETIHLGRDNAIDLVLVADDAALALGAITRCTLVLGGVTLDSDTLGLGAGQPFDPTQSGTYNQATVDVLRLTLGAAGGLAAGNYRAVLTVYDPDHANGLVWGDPLPVRVV